MSGLHVLFKLADADYAVPAEDVLHMESFGGATPVPGAAPYVAGIAQIRRHVVPVVDLRARFGIACEEPTLDSRVVVVKSGSRVVGLLVDSAREVLVIDADQFHPPPEMVTTRSAGFVQAVAQVEGRLLMRIDVAKVVGEEISHGQ